MTKRKNKKKSKTSSISNYILGLISGIIITVIGIIISNYISERKELEQYLRTIPKLSIDIQELNGDSLAISIESINKGSCKIDKIFFSFDIPGTIDTFLLRNKDASTQYSYTAQYPRALGNVRIKENVRFEISNLYPDSYFRGYLRINRTKNWIEKHDFEYFYYYPYLDIHDYLLFNIIFTYEGTSRIVTDTLNLGKLAYVVDDNMNLLTSKHYIKSSINDYLKNLPNDRITIFVKENMEQIKRVDTTLLTLIKDSLSKDDIIITNDSIFRILTHKNMIYKNYNDILNMELERVQSQISPHYKSYTQ